MRRYELMLLLRPDLEDDRLQSAVERVTRAIVNAGGSLSKVSPWGKRRLAYDIGHHREASYFLIHLDIEPAEVRGIERGLLISEDILRHLVTVIEDRGPVDEIPEAAVAPARASGEEAEPAEPAPAARTDEEAAAETPSQVDETAGVAPEPSTADDTADVAAEAPTVDDMGDVAAETASDEEREAARSEASEDAALEAEAERARA
jgi:small subunit ribosomal protein S6